MSSSAEAIWAFTATSSGSSTALSVVLGGLLDGLLGPMVRFGVGAAEPTSNCSGDVGAVEESRVEGVACPPCTGDILLNSSAIRSTFLPL